MSGVVNKIEYIVNYTYKTNHKRKIYLIKSAEFNTEEDENKFVNLHSSLNKSQTIKISCKFLRRLYNTFKKSNLINRIEIIIIFLITFISLIPFFIFLPFTVFISYVFKELSEIYEDCEKLIFFTYFFILFMVFGYVYYIKL